jgi:hypothetical protein
VNRSVEEPHEEINRIIGQTRRLRVLAGVLAFMVLLEVVAIAYLPWGPQ